jgi:hypothetical protein
MLFTNDRHECINRLLGGIDDPHPEPEEMESLCRLLHTAGKALDEGKSKTRMNAIYDALGHIHRHSDLDSRIKFNILVCPASHLTVGCHRITQSRMARSS